MTLTASVLSGAPTLFTVSLVTPTQTLPLGQFAVADRAFHGTDSRGVSYHGTVTETPGPSDDLQVTAQVDIPAGALITSAGPSSASTVSVSLVLDPDHLGGNGTVPVELPGYGTGDVRISPANAT